MKFQIDFKQTSVRKALKMSNLIDVMHIDTYTHTYLYLTHMHPSVVRNIKI